MTGSQHTSVVHENNFVFPRKIFENKRLRIWSFIQARECFSFIQPQFGNRKLSFRSINWIFLQENHLSNLSNVLGEFPVNWILVEYEAWVGGMASRKCLPGSIETNGCRSREEQNGRRGEKSWLAKPVWPDNWTSAVVNSVISSRLGSFNSQNRTINIKMGDLVALSEISWRKPFRLTPFRLTVFAP